jgi:hypothetical protein
LRFSNMQGRFLWMRAGARTHDTDRSEVAAHPSAGGSTAAIRSKLADVWPQALLELGGLLTLTWTCGLAWLLVRVLRLV